MMSQLPTVQNRVARLMPFAGVALWLLTALFVPRAAADTPGLPGLMVFIAHVDAQWDVYCWRPTGDAPPRRLTNQVSDAINPALAADGSYVVYETSDGHLWRVSTSGGDPVRLTDAADAGRYLQPALHPRHSALLCARRAQAARDDTNLALWTPLPGDAAETALTRLGPQWKPTDEPGGANWLMDMVSSQFSPAWSADGERVVFVHLQDRGTVSGRTIAELWQGRVHDSYARQLTLTDSLCDDPAWAPDGQHVVYAGDLHHQFDLYEVNVATRAVRRLTESPAAEVDPVYSPDGRYIGFVCLSGGRPRLRLLQCETLVVQDLQPFDDPDVPCKDIDWR